MAETRLARLRRERGWSQELLAKRAGVALQTMIRIERDEVGPRGPNLRAVMLLASELGVTPEELLEDRWRPMLERTPTLTPVTAGEAAQVPNSADVFLGIDSEPDALDALAGWLEEKGLRLAELESDPTAAIVKWAEKLGLTLRPATVPAGAKGEPMMAWLVFSSPGSAGLMGMLLTTERQVRLLRVVPVRRA
jgi:transcriptional regulator with XRE-family HTH domain